MSTSSSRPPDEPTDEQLGRLRNAIVAHAASSPDPAQIRRRTLERLDQSPFAALVMADNAENPLTWCEKHPGQTANVRLTVSVEDSEGWANAVAVHGTLKRIPDDTMLARPAAGEASSLLSSTYFVPAAGSSEENAFTLRADGDVGDDLEEVAQEIDDLNFDLTESIFELNLSGLPSGLRLATAEVQAMPTASLSVATATEIWPKFAQRFKTMRPRVLRGDSPNERELSAESSKVARTLYADSRDPAQPFLTVQSPDNFLKAKLKDNAELEVSVKDSAWPNRHQIVAEVMYRSESGLASHRYVLNDQPATRNNDELIFRQQIRVPADAVDAEVTLNVRGMTADEVCILPDSMRRALFPKLAARCGLTVRGHGPDGWRLSVFTHDLHRVGEGLSTSVLFRVVEQNCTLGKMITRNESRVCQAQSGGVELH